MLVGALAVLSAGCGDIVDDLLPQGGSCGVASTSTCIDYTGTGWRTPGSARSACNNVGMGAVYSDSPCATAQRVATCRVQSGQASELSTRYYGPRFTTATAQAACTAIGNGAVFTAN